MKKRIYSLATVLLLTAGLLLTTGCSKSDQEENTPEPVLPATDTNKDAAQTATPLAVAASTLNQDMADLDFAKLAPLAETVPTLTRANEDNAAVAFERELSELLTILRGEETTTRSLPTVTLGRRFSFEAFNRALQLAWDISVTLGEQGESSSSWFGLNTTKRGEVNYTAGNGDLYTVKGVIDKNVSVQFRGFNTKIVVSKASELYIYKNEEQVLKILSSSENNRPVWLPILIKDNFYTGQLFYDDYEVNLTYDKNSTHQRTVDLTYSKAGTEGVLLAMTVKLEDDADILKIIKHDVEVKAQFTVQALDEMLTFNGDVKNVNYMVVDGLKVAQSMKQGTSEDECKSMVERFNDNLTLTMTLMDMPVGALFMGSQYSVETGLYYPTIMVNSSMLGDSDYTLTNLLGMMGVDVPDILQNVAEIGQGQ